MGDDNAPDSSYDERKAANEGDTGMDYNLWMSEDSHYSLGNRIGTHTSEPPAVPEQAADAAAQPSTAEMDHIEFLMETLGRRLEEGSPGF